MLADDVTTAAGVLTVRNERLDGPVTPPGAHDLSVPEQAGLTPAGWYMLVVLDDDGVPSPARWVHVR